MKPKFRTSYEGFNITLMRDFIPIIDFSILGISLFYIGFCNHSWGDNIDKKMEVVLLGFGISVGIDNY